MVNYRSTIAFVEPCIMFNRCFVYYNKISNTTLCSFIVMLMFAVLQCVMLDVDAGSWVVNRRRRRHPASQTPGVPDG